MIDLPLISIITPAYNAEKFILRCIENLQVNDVKFEHIIVDDCSSDSTVLLIENYLNNNVSNISLIKQDVNLGPGPARNKALSIANGEYIIFCDADDFIFQHSLKKIQESIKHNNKPDIIIFGYILDSGLNKKTVLPNTMNESSSSIDVFRQEYILDKIISAPWGKVIKTSIIKDNDILFPNFLNGEDAIFNLNVILKSRSFLYLNEAFYYFDKTNESLTRKDFDEKEYSLLLNSFDAFEKEIVKNNLLEQFEEELKARRLSFLCVNVITRLALSEKKYQKRIPRKILTNVKNIASKNKFYTSKYLSIKAKILIGLFIVCPSITLLLFSKKLRSN